MSLLPKKYTDVVLLIPGKNASVFRARNSFLDREVFLKIYDVPKNDPKSALQEPQLLQSLSHPNLVRIYSAGAVKGNRLLLEMELIAGGSLKDLLDQAAQQRIWPGIGFVLALTADIAHGLSALHAKGLVHRDIKPANVMIRKAQNREHAVVTDLGLASALDDYGRAFSSRHARIYRPPEVWEGNGYSKASDVYQTGLILYQLLGGKLSYDKANLDDNDLAELTITGTLFDLSDVGPHVERKLRTLLGKCVCPEAMRISTMPDLISAIQSVTAAANCMNGGRPPIWITRSVPRRFWMRRFLKTRPWSLPPFLILQGPRGRHFYFIMGSGLSVRKPMTALRKRSNDFLLRR